MTAFLYLGAALLASYFIHHYSRKSALEIQSKKRNNYDVKEELIVGKDMNKDQIEKVISRLKASGSKPTETIVFLKDNLNISLTEAKDLVFDSKSWEGLRESSENLTQQFMDAWAEHADKVEYDEEGKVVSISTDLTKENKTEKKT